MLLWPEVASYPFGKAYVMPCQTFTLHEHATCKHTQNFPLMLLHLACIKPAARSPSSATSRFSLRMHTHTSPQSNPINPSQTKENPNPNPTLFHPSSSNTAFQNAPNSPSASSPPTKAMTSLPPPPPPQSTPAPRSANSSSSATSSRQ